MLLIPVLGDRLVLVVGVTMMVGIHQGQEEAEEDIEVQWLAVQAAALTDIRPCITIDSNKMTLVSTAAQWH